MVDLLVRSEKDHDRTACCLRSGGLDLPEECRHKSYCIAKHSRMPDCPNDASDLWSRIRQLQAGGRRRSSRRPGHGAAHLILLVGRKHDRMLLLRHRHRHKWGTPGGERDRKKSSGRVEDYFEAMKREFREETGTRIPRLYEIEYVQPYRNVRVYVAKTRQDLRRLLPRSYSLHTTETDRWAIPKVRDVLSGNKYALRGGVRKALRHAAREGLV